MCFSLPDRTQELEFGRRERKTEGGGRGGILRRKTGGRVEYMYVWMVGDCWVNGMEME